MNKQIRIIIDIVMALLMPLLMAYSLIGETLHEIIGTAILVLFVVHHILNRRWYGAMFRGKYNAARVFRTVLNILLLAFMILQPLSGILLSKHLYTFLPTLPISAQARSVHMLLAYWGYVLLCVHAGTHLTAPIKQLITKNPKAAAAVFILLGGISVYGIIAFVKRGFPGYMFAKTAFAFFDYSEPVVLFFLDYLAIMVLFMTAGWLIICALNRTRKKGKRNPAESTEQE